MTDWLAALGPLAPQIIVAVTGAAVLVTDLLRSQTTNGDAAISRAVAIAGLALATAAAIATAGVHSDTFGDTIVTDPLVTFLDLVFLGIGLAVVLMSGDVVERITHSPAEYYALVAWCTLGNMLVAPSADLVALFVALQLTSVPLLVLIAFDRHDPRGREAGLKYLAVVLVSTAVFLYGFSLVYAQTGTTGMAAIGRVFATDGISAVAALGLVLMLAGFGFKVSAAPFQQWAPDVYEGAPTPVTALLAVGSKLAGFALVTRFAVTALHAPADARIVFAVLAAASMTLGNLGALQQTDLKRLLAYSGIAQAGYILVGLAAMSDAGVSAMLFYLAAYAVANLLAFAAIIAVAHVVGSTAVADFAGLARRAPLAAAALTVALLSLAGLPLTVGFVAKFSVFISAARVGMYWLVLVAVANTVLAFAYYLRIVWTLFVPETDAPRIVVRPHQAALMASGAVAVIAVGVFPGSLLAAATHVARLLFGG